MSPLATEPVVDQALPHSPHLGSVESDDFQEYQEFHAASHDEDKMASGAEKSHDAVAVPKLDSSGSDNLGFAAQANNFAPSMASSGYASQAVSIQTLSSEDSGSVKSIGTDDIIVDVSVEKKPTGSEDAVEKDTSMDRDDDDGVATNVHLDRVVDDMLATGGSSVQDIDACVSEISRGADNDLENRDSVNINSTKDASEAERESVGSGSSGAASDGSSTMSETLSTHEDEAVVTAEVLTDATLKLAEESVDYYSETAMDELERLSDDAEGTSVVNNATCSADPELIIAQSHTCENDTDEIVRQHPNDDSVNSEGVKSRSGSPACPNSRRNLSDELESSVVAPIVNGGRFPEIKPGVNFGKGANFKKLRTAADSRTSKSGVSPVKATYRPTSMTQEMMMSLEEALQPEEEEETHNSGWLLHAM